MQHYNPIGSVHGGIALTLLDSAMGCAIHTLLEAGVGYTTLEVKTNFVRPITVETGAGPLRGQGAARGLAGRDGRGQAHRRCGKAARARHDDLPDPSVSALGFTTRPELRGTFGMVASTHWLASAAGMSVLERGGNAFDAAVATGFTLQVVEPHLNGPGGEVPAVFFPVARGEPVALCGQGVAPAAATIERYRELGHELVPGTGVLAACVPGAFGGWLLLLEQFGTWRLEDVLEFAIGYAEDGFPLVAGDPRDDRPHRGAARRLAGVRRASISPRPRSARSSATPRSPRRTGASSRSRAAARARTRSSAPAPPGTRASSPRRSTASSPPRAACSPATTWPRWRASLEPPATLDYRGLTVCKTLPWGAGPGRAAAAGAARGLRPGRALARGARPRRHRVREARASPTGTRSTATREVPLETLLSQAYNDERRALVGEDASDEYRPGLGAPAAGSSKPRSSPGAGEPTRGDTVHLDVADR